jgi:Fur family ferric uptake transcriptional regulator
MATISWTDDTLAVLDRAGFRSGSARRAVIELLGRQDCCVTAQEIFDGLRGEGRSVGIASVYRVLDLLTERGLVQRIDVGAGMARFEPLYRSGEHHHHLVCDRCGEVTSFEDRDLERAIQRLAKRVDYAVGAHDVTLRGECPACRARA